MGTSSADALVELVVWDRLGRAQVEIWRLIDVGLLVREDLAPVREVGGELARQDDSIFTAPMVRR